MHHNRRRATEYNADLSARFTELENTYLEYTESVPLVQLKSPQHIKQLSKYKRDWDHLTQIAKEHVKKHPDNPTQEVLYSHCLYYIGHSLKELGKAVTDSKGVQHSVDIRQNIKAYRYYDQAASFLRKSLTKYKALGGTNKDIKVVEQDIKSTKRLMKAITAKISDPARTVS